LNTSLTLGLATLLILLGIAIAGALVLRRLNRRNASLRRLLELADRVEADLKSCRARLKQAHAVMSMNPDLPAAGEQEAAHAVDAGLRALLQQRLWIRDCAPTASQGELDAAADSMGQTRDRLQPLLQALGEAQDELDTAMREHIRQDSHL
jgi:HAMP domain-containing protein